MLLFAAPLQGFTDARFRCHHHQHYGGIAEYYAPFARLEHGRIRDKDRRDILPDRNRGVPTVPQLICRNRDEFAILADAIQHLGYTRIDINMGCPFPLQVSAGRGSGILPHPDRIEGILREVETRPDVAFSIKMRLGLDDRMQCFDILPIINQSAIMQVTLHPRLGIQQYNGEVDLEAFSLFYESCAKPLVYNGDIRTPADILRIQKAYPNLHAIMIGRALIDTPNLPCQWSQ